MYPDDLELSIVDKYTHLKSASGNGMSKRPSLFEYDLSQ